jgi:hypothetical protein
MPRYRRSLPQSCVWFPLSAICCIWPFALPCQSPMPASQHMAFKVLSYNI